MISFNCLHSRSSLFLSDFSSLSQLSASTLLGFVIYLYIYMEIPRIRVGGSDRNEDRQPFILLDADESNEPSISISTYVQSRTHVLCGKCPCAIIASAEAALHFHSLNHPPIHNHKKDESASQRR